jgi:hypothetical protein
MLDPRPSLADAVQDCLSASTVSKIRCREVYHQQPPTSIDRDVTLAPDDLLVGIVTARTCCWLLDGLTVDDRCRWTCIASQLFTIHHQGNIVDGAEQQQS